MEREKERKQSCICIYFILNRVDTLRREINIALVGKYTTLEDSYTSVAKALQHAAISAGYKVNIIVSPFSLFESY